MELIKYVMKYIDQIKIRFLVGIVLLGSSMVLSIIHPVLMGKYIDSLSTDFGKRRIMIFVLLLVALWLVSVAISYLNAVNSAHMNIRLVYSINFHLLQHAVRLPYAVLAKTDTAYLNSRIHSDSSVLAGFFLDSFLGTIAKAVICLVILGVILFTTPVVGFLIMLLFLFYMTVYAHFKHMIEKCGKKTMESRDAFFGEMQKQLNHIRTIKLNAWYERLNSSLFRQFDPVYHAAINSAQINALYSVFIQATQIVANLFILLICGLAVSRGSMKLSNLITVSSLFATLFSSFTSLMDFGKSYANAHVAFDRIKELEMIEEEKNGELVPDRITEIQINNLIFRYPDDSKILIDHVSLNFVSGKIYQIKGNNGCGKSTLLNLLLGLYESNGAICFNGVPINLLNMLSVRQKMISVVEQEPPLIFESISENIIGDGTDEYELSKRICKAGLDLFVGNMSLTTNRSLANGASSLSGGEKQKATIVRALLKDSDVLIFDEPTSALDSQSCNQLKEILNRLKENRIIILVDHRLVFSDIIDESYNFCTEKVSLELSHQEIEHSFKQ